MRVVFSDLILAIQWQVYFVCRKKDRSSAVLQKPRKSLHEPLDLFFFSFAELSLPVIFLQCVSFLNGSL